MRISLVDRSPIQEQGFHLNFMMHFGWGMSGNYLGFQAIVFVVLHLVQTMLWLVVMVA